MFLNLTEASKYSGAKPYRLKQARREGDLPKYSHMAGFWVKVEDLDIWIERQKVPARYDIQRQIQRDILRDKTRKAKRKAG